MNRTSAIRLFKILTLIGVYGGLLLPLIFVPKVIFPFVFSKLLYFQILIGLTFPAYLALAWMEPKYRPKLSLLYSAVAAYFVALTLSVIFAVDPVRGWWGNQERMNGLFTLLHFFAWFTMVTTMLKTWDAWKNILHYQIVLSVFMAIVALLQKPFPKLLMFQASDRVGGLLDNPIYMAAYQIFNLFFIALIWMRGASKQMKIWLAVAAIFDIAAFIAASSRGALVGLAAGVAMFAVVYAILSPSKKAKATVLTVAIAGLLSYGVLYTFRETAFVKSTPLYRLTDLRATTETRFIAWKIAWQGFLERPLTGWGLDNFHILFNEKYNPQSLRFGYYETWFDRAHNTVMDALSMTGMFGFLTFFGMFGATFYSTIRAFKKKWIDIPTASVFFGLPVAYFFQNLFVFDQPAGYTMSFFMYAFVAAATTSAFAGKTEEPVEGKAQNAPLVTYGIAMAIMLLVVWRTSILPAKASILTINSNNYFAGGLYAQALDFAKQAAAIPTPYLDEQTFLQSRNLMSLKDSNALDKTDWKAWYALVTDVTDRHLADHPRNTHPHFIYGRFLQSFGPLVPEATAKAEQEYLAAIKTSPKRQQLYFTLGRFYIEAGKKQEGYEQFQSAVEFDPEIGEAHWFAGISLSYDLGKFEEGSKEIQKAFTVKSPYVLKEVREAVAVADAYATLKDPEGFKKLMVTLQTLPGGSVQWYLAIARAAEDLGLIEERNTLLGAIVQGDPSIAPRLVPLQNGSATSIVQSLNMTEPVATTTSPVTTPSTPPITSTTQPAFVATSSAGGPRLR